jgi:hypothetical protein
VETEADQNLKKKKVALCLYYNLELAKKQSFAF